MRRGIVRSGIVLLLVLGTLPLGTGERASATHEPTLIATMPVQTSSAFPRTDGTFVVWQTNRAPGVWDINAARLDDRRIFPVAADPPASRSAQDIDGGIVVWSDDGGIQAKDLATGRTFTVEAGPTAFPAISGNWVVWRRIEGGVATFKARNAGTMTPPITLTQQGGTNYARPTFRGERLVWHEVGEASYLRGPIPWRLLTLTLSSSGPTVVAEGQGDIPYDFDGVDDVVVYALRSDPPVLIAADLRTGQQRGLAVNGLQPTTDGRYIFYTSSASWKHSLAPVDLRGYDLATDSDFLVARDLGTGGLPHTNGGALTWVRHKGEQQAEVHASRVADLLPSAPRPGPALPEAAYFPETGHSLIFGFKSFWEASGGLPVFGYPLTEEFDQLNADTERMHPVQYLERQRFEYHPELAGTPYEVSLGRLGAEDAARRHLTGLWAFQPLPATQAARADCTYLPEVQHRLCGEFRPYWESHGLELGDPGVSFRESLALFGYPLSEEFIDPATGLITQYFERAVFEYHPTNPAPYRVQLKRLSADRLAQHGW